MTKGISSECDRAEFKRIERNLEEYKRKLINKVYDFEEDQFKVDRWECKARNISRCLNNEELKSSEELEPSEGTSVGYI